MILILDNYDSFTYNLVQRLGEIDAAPGLTCEERRGQQRRPDEELIVDLVTFGIVRPVQDQGTYGREAFKV